ncbi:MAG TPA: hypothetical protein VHC19_23385 [Pirellulales bacterium]|nr:hypothetical protein [Pirellulales bacterium]
MSLPDSTDPGRGLVVQKPKANVYTVLLGIALVAVLMSILFLCLEMSRYNWDIKAAGQSAVGYIPASNASPANGLPAAERLLA